MLEPRGGVQFLESGNINNSLYPRHAGIRLQYYPTERPISTIHRSCAYTPITLRDVPSTKKTLFRFPSRVIAIGRLWYRSQTRPESVSTRCTRHFLLIRSTYSFFKYFLNNLFLFILNDSCQSLPDYIRSLLLLVIEALTHSLARGWNVYVYQEQRINENISKSEIIVSLNENLYMDLWIKVTNKTKLFENN